MNSLLASVFCNFCGEHVEYKIPLRNASTYPEVIYVTTMEKINSAGPMQFKIPHTCKE